MVTKKQCEDLMDRLADKSLTFGCLVLLGEDRRKYRVLNQWNNDMGYKYITVWSDRLGEDVHQIGKRGEELGYKTEIIGHDILIGDVLAALDEAKEEYGLRFAGEFLSLWRLCPDPKDANSITGLKRSLQAIFADIEWEAGYMHNGVFTPSECTVEVEIAKPSHATDLFTFLIGLGL